MSFTVVKKNLVANFAGSGWTALLALVLIPVYIRFLGIEAWGVVGIFTSLQSLALLLDLGLSATLNREMARLSLQLDKAHEMRSLVRTFELIYWGVAVAIGALIFALAPLIARWWVHANEVQPETITNAIRLMGLAITFQWPFALYSGGLVGLQRQVLLSAMNVGLATLRGAGAVFVLWRVSPTLQAFFLWQVVIGLLQTIITGWFLWRNLPGSERRAEFQRELLRQRWRFAAGMSGIMVMSLILTQMDKVILSRLLSLEMFGYYVLASSVATSLYLLVLPLFSALSPRLTQLVSLGDMVGLKEIYHHGCQLMSVLIIPISSVIALFSRQILFVWTGNPATVEHTHLVLSILITGTALNGLMYLPIGLQLAYGWTKLAFYIDVVAVLILTPAIIVMANLYGGVGAALIWVIFNACLILFGILFMHRRMLKGEQWRWCLEDVGLPLAVSLGVALFCRALMPLNGSRLQLLAVLAGITVLIISSTLLATPVTRAALMDYFRSRRGRALDLS